MTLDRSVILDAHSELTAAELTAALTYEFHVPEWADTPFYRSELDSSFRITVFDYSGTGGLSLFGVDSSLHLSLEVDDDGPSHIELWGRFGPDIIQAIDGHGIARVYGFDQILWSPDALYVQNSFLSSDKAPSISKVWPQSRSTILFDDNDATTWPWFRFGQNEGQLMDEQAFASVAKRLSQLPEAPDIPLLGSIEHWRRVPGNMNNWPGHRAFPRMCAMRCELDQYAQLAADNEETQFLAELNRRLDLSDEAFMKATVHDDEFVNDYNDHHPNPLEQFHRDTPAYWWLRRRPPEGELLDQLRRAKTNPN